MNVPRDKVTLISSGIEGLRSKPHSTPREQARTGAWFRGSSAQRSSCRCGTPLTMWRAGGRGGWVCNNRINADANGFTEFESGAKVHITCALGALLLMWADGPERWPTAEQNDNINLFGFRKWLRLQRVSPSAANRLAINRFKVLLNCVCSALLAAENSRASRSCWPCTNDAPGDRLMLMRTAVRSHIGLPGISPPLPQANAGGTTVDI